MNTIVIGDVAGEFDALMRLMAKLPEGQIVLVGDLNDRGPQSKEVIEWAMTTPNVATVHSNHGDLFVDYYHQVMDADYKNQYSQEDFMRNGGLATLRSYDAGPHEAFKIPVSHIQWLASRPLFFENEHALVSHAPLIPNVRTDDESIFNEYLRQEIIWNRYAPEKRDKLQVFGHNSHWGVKSFNGDDGSTWAVCIDGSRSRVLTALVLPEGKIIQEPYDLPDKGHE